MSTIPAAPTATDATMAPAPHMDVAPNSNVDDATYMINTFSTLLEGDLYDDELNEISTLFAPAVSDDEKSSSDSPVPSVDYENHPGAQVAVTAAAIDSALLAPKAEAPSNKRPYESAIPTAVPPPAPKRRITMSSSCGSLPSLPNPVATVSAPSSPKSVVVPAPVTPPTPSGLTVSPSVESAPQFPDVATSSTSAATEKVKKTKAAPTITIRQGMTPEEKAKACRERNREHARKTRLRKKAYVDELKRSLNEMVEERDAAKALEEQKAKILEQNRDVRFQVMQDFLNLRGNNEQSANRWSAILVPEEFTLTLPVTDFQAMVQPTETSPVPGQQVLTGVSDVMSDSSYFSSFLQTLGGSDANEASAPVYFIYNCSRDSFLMDGCNAMFNFDATSCGAMAQGTAFELASSGTFRASFCPETNRLRSAQLMFDTGSIRFQVDRMQTSTVHSAPATTGPVSN